MDVGALIRALAGKHESARDAVPRCAAGDRSLELRHRRRYHHLMLKLMVVSVLLIVGCGPSTAEIKTAKETTYVGDAVDIFNAAQQVVGENYKLQDVGRADEGFRLVTVEQWYSPEGGRQSAGGGDFVQVVDRSVLLQMIVDVVPTASDRVVIQVTPRTLQHISGSPKPRELAPDDPNVPGWVTGRVDQLHHDIYKGLQRYVVK